MDAKPHYFKIGLFVLAAVVLIVVAVVIFGAGLLAQDQLYFESYFAESITGLSVGSPLEFRGVRIGQVTQIGFVGNVYALRDENGDLSSYASYVRVVTAVPRTKLPDLAAGQVREVLGQMIARGLRVRITSNILTGQAYLEANYVDPNRFPVEEVAWRPKYPVIPSAPGELTTLKDSIDNILTQLEEIDVKNLVKSLDRVFTSLDQAISEANLAELSMEARALLRVGRERMEALKMDEINAATLEFLASLNQAVADAELPELSRQMRDVLAETDQKLAALNVAKINAGVEELLDSVNRVMADANIPALSREAQRLIIEVRTTNQHLQSLLAPAEGAAPTANVPEVMARLSQTIAQLNRVLATEGPEIEAILAEFSRIAENLNALIASLREQPSSLLLGGPPPRSEVLK